MAIVCFDCLLLVPFVIFGLVFALIGCTAKDARNSESSDKKSLMNLSSEKKEAKPTGSQMKKKTNENVQRMHTTSAPSKETGNPPKAKEKLQKSQPPPPVPSDVDGAKQSKKSNKSKQASVKKPLPSVENTQKPSDDLDQQQTDANFFATKISQEPNDFEKAAAAEGLVVNPAKVKRMGNIDDIYEMKKEEQNKEFDNIKTVSSKAIGKDENKETAPKKVTIRDEKCKLFETTDLPTPDDGDDENEEQI